MTDVDAKWVEKAAEEIIGSMSYQGDAIWVNENDQYDIAAIIRRHAPAIDLSAIREKVEQGAEGIASKIQFSCVFYNEGEGGKVCCDSMELVELLKSEILALLPKEGV